MSIFQSSCMKLMISHRTDSRRLCLLCIFWCPVATYIVWFVFEVFSHIIRSESVVDVLVVCGRAHPQRGPCGGWRLQQGHNHVVKVGGPVLWSRVLLPFYRKKLYRSTQFGAVGYIITLYSSKSYVKSWGVRPNFGEVRTHRHPCGCAHELQHVLLSPAGVSIAPGVT